MPLSGANLRAKLADRNLNPIRQVAAAPAGQVGGAQIIVTLNFIGGKSIAPEEIFDALETKYGAGKVSSNHDSPSMGNYQFNIAP